MTKNKLTHPLFILSVIILIMNDFYLKQAFGNAVTGKLSDFVGLFAFPFFFSCLFPNWKKYIHLFTVLLFVWWKSEFSETFILWVNTLGLLIGRVVDFSDNIALISILASYIVFSKSTIYKNIKLAYTWVIIFVSCFAFTATTMAPRGNVGYTDINKEYRFDMPVEKLVNKFNKLQMKEINKIGFGNSELGTFNEADGVFYSNHRDTLAYIINMERDKINDTIHVRTYLSYFQIYETDYNKSAIKLINTASYVYLHKQRQYIDSVYINKDNQDDYNSYIYSHKYTGKKYAVIPAKEGEGSKLQQKIIKEFEKRIVKKID